MSFAAFTCSSSLIFVTILQDKEKLSDWMQTFDEFRGYNEKARSELGKTFGFFLYKDDMKIVSVILIWFIYLIKKVYTYVFLNH